MEKSTSSGTAGDGNGKRGNGGECLDVAEGLNFDPKWACLRWTVDSGTAAGGLTTSGLFRSRVFRSVADVGERDADWGETGGDRSLFRRSSVFEQFPFCWGWWTVAGEMTETEERNRGEVLGDGITSLSGDLRLLLWLTTFTIWLGQGFFSTTGTGLSSKELIWLTLLKRGVLGPFLLWPAPPLPPPLRLSERLRTWITYGSVRNWMESHKYCVAVISQVLIPFSIPFGGIRGGLTAVGVTVVVVMAVEVCRRNEWDPSEVRRVEVDEQLVEETGVSWIWDALLIDFDFELDGGGGSWEGEVGEIGRAAPLDRPLRVGFSKDRMACVEAWHRGDFRGARRSRFFDSRLSPLAS